MYIRHNEKYFPIFTRNIFILFAVNNLFIPLTAYYVGGHVKLRRFLPDPKVFFAV
jgi:hypothetical protein